MITAIAVVIILCFAYFMQAAFAFGGPLIAVPLLSLFIGAKDAVVMTTIFSILGSVLIFQLWKHINWRQIRWLVPSLFLGLAGGLALFAYLDERILAVVLAIYIIAHVTNDFLKLKAMARLNKMVPENLQSFIGGFGGGLIQGATGVGGGPPVVAYLKSHTRSVDEFRATYMFAWLIANIARLLFLGSADFVHGKIIEHSSITLLFFIPAIYAGYHLPKKIGEKSFYFVLNILLVLSAISILVKEFT